MADIDQEVAETESPASAESIMADPAHCHPAEVAVEESSSVDTAPVTNEAAKTLLQEAEAKIAQLANVAHMFYVDKIRQELIDIVGKIKTHL